MIPLKAVTELFIEEEEQDIAVYSCSKGKEVFRGKASELPREYMYSEIEGIDTLFEPSTCIVFNIA